VSTAATVRGAVRKVRRAPSSLGQISKGSFSAVSKPIFATKILVVNTHVKALLGLLHRAPSSWLERPAEAVVVLATSGSRSRASTLERAEGRKKADFRWSILCYF